MSSPVRVVAFGTFDPLHPGHHHFFEQARAQGSWLVVVVARDSWLRQHKHREPNQTEDKRLGEVASLPEVDEAILGDEWPSNDPFRLLSTLSFDVVVLGYDQKPSDDEVRRELTVRGRPDVRIVRLKPHRPEEFKSSLFHDG